jgi:L,D-transpeptidase catalytic domain
MCRGPTPCRSSGVDGGIIGSVIKRFLLVAAAAAIVAPACSAAAPKQPPPPPTTLPPLQVTPPPQRPAYPEAAAPRKRYVGMWTRPSEARPASFAFDTRLPGGGLGRMLVTDERTDGTGERWLRVQLPLRPNERQAWVRRDEVRLVPLHDRLVIDLSQRTLARFHDRNRVARFQVGVGRTQYPTALGTFYVWLKVNFGQWYGPYGIYALGLSGFSPVLSDWPGGGRMAIHGTYNPTDRGQKVSHGCIRVYNAQMATLRSVPLGTPVIIRR